MPNTQTTAIRWEDTLLRGDCVEYQERGRWYAVEIVFREKRGAMHHFTLRILSSRLAHAPQGPVAGDILHSCIHPSWPAEAGWGLAPLGTRYEEYRGMYEV